MVISEDPLELIASLDFRYCRLPVKKQKQKGLLSDLLKYELFLFRNLLHEPKYNTVTIYGIRKS